MNNVMQLKATTWQYQSKIKQNTNSVLMQTGYSPVVITFWLQDKKEKKKVWVRNPSMHKFEEGRFLAVILTRLELTINILFAMMIPKTWWPAA